MLLCVALPSLGLDHVPAREEAVAFLDANAFPDRSFLLLHVWTERSAVDPVAYLQGYHVRERATGQEFDVYARDNVLLASSQLQALGVAEKSWGLKDEAPFEAAPLEQRQTTPSAPSPLIRQAPLNASVAVPPVDLEQIALEDRIQDDSGEKGPERFGVFQPLDKPLVPGSWTTMQDGSRVWRVAIDSPDALGLRLEFSALSLPAGAALYVYGEAYPDFVFGPYTAMPDGEPVLWTPSCYGPRAVIECHVPAGTDLASLVLRVERVAYLYRTPKAMAEYAAGLCNLDVTCYPEWAEAAKAVAGLGIVGNTGVLFCTCTRIADLNRSTDVPYVLTANHCVQGQSGSYGASSLEFYWFYQTAACNGAPPLISSVPRTTGGADYLAGMGGTGMDNLGNDFTLLRMRQAPPASTSQLGWRAEVPAQGSEMVCMSHPQRDYKRIAFGTNTGISAYFHTMTWHGGTTEGGSSGSALVLAGTQQIVGQLWGGYASCSFPDQPDYFGRFDITYPIVKYFLGTTPSGGFSSATYSFSESAGISSIPITLDSPANYPFVSVGYTIAAGTAQSGDFVAAEGVLIIPGGALEASVPLSILSDTLHESTETVLVTLHDPLYMKQKSGSAQAIVQILDDDPDRDGDGLSDYEEEHGTFGHVSNPDQPDSDFDGLTDDVEVLGLRGSATNPMSGDSDGDGVSDLMEILGGSNPADPASTVALSSLAIPWFKVVR